jgi:metallo-beta-lactamase family protein
MATIQFCGAAQTVTGSMHLVHANGRRVLLDCGLFQGLKQLRLRNWREPPFDPTSLDAVVISHAHIDHTGSLPLLVRRGYRGPIYCTPGTRELLGVLLPDAAHLQEEEAERANRRGYSKHKPALPLYTAADAQRALEQLQPAGYGRPFPVAGDISVTYRRAGHILGAATVDVQPGRGSRIVFSGDLGRYDRPILPDPEPVPEADVLLLESTYGDRTHPVGAAEALAQVVNDTARRGGTLLVPAFVVDRTQELLWMLQRLEDEKRIPVLPVYLDSPSATEVTKIYHRHAEDHDADMRSEIRDGQDPLRPERLQFCSTVEQSKRLNDINGPVIIVSASGMATGGRILHHLQRRLPMRAPPCCWSAFKRQEPAVARSRTARSRSECSVPMSRCARAEILQGLSAHADQPETLRWLGGFSARRGRPISCTASRPRRTLLAAVIHARLGWTVRAARVGSRSSCSQAPAVLLGARGGSGDRPGGGSGYATPAPSPAPGWRRADVVAGVRAGTTSSIGDGS